MNKNQKSMIFLGMISVMVIGMIVLYANFLNDKPAIIAQENQGQQSQQVLSPDQMVNGVKSFIDTTTSTIHAPPLKP